jgi:hypothetical protein
MNIRVNYLGDAVVEGRLIIRRAFKETGCDTVDWIELAEGRVLWQGLVNVLLNQLAS